MLRTTALGSLAAILALATAPGTTRADHDRPFKGSVVSIATSFSVTEDGRLQIDGTLTGQATLVGKLTGTFTYFVSLDGTFTGIATKVAANGDELHETLVGHFDSLTTSVGFITIVGGTGRFAHATGSTTLNGTVVSDVQIDVAFSGTISVPE